MSVFVILHDDGIDAGLSIRNIYATREAAETAVPSRTASGRLSQSYWAHGTNCCSVHEYEVQGEAVVDTREDDPPPDPNAPRLIPDSLIQSLIGQTIGVNPYRTIK